MPDAHPFDEGERLEPTWGLGTLADPVQFGAALVDLAGRAARDPARLATTTTRLAAGVAEAGAAVTARALGRSTPGPVEVDPRDSRFSDPAWETNPFFYGLRQVYLLWADAMRSLTEAPAENEVLARKARFAVDQIVDALAPTNFLPGNPTALRKAFETGGASVARGAGKFLDDLVSNGGRPQMVDRSAFTLGKDIAATPGKVVFRNRLMELIQYEPRTETVFETPVLLSPPWINKYYVMDLAPGKSLAEWAIEHGHTVFAISYHNPDETSRELGLEDYLKEGPLTALEVVEEITGAKQTNIAALCLGGTLASVLLGYLARTKAGRDRVRSVTLLNTLVDFSEPGALGCFVDEESVRRLERRMSRHGYLPAQDMAGTFNMLRANDLIWRYVTSNWLMGEDPPPFDLLAWNDDKTRMPARMQSDYLRACYLENRLANGTFTVDGKRISLRNATADVYIVAAIEDHITPWTGGYLSTRLFGGQVRFVLSSSGHIAGVVNPPGGRRHHWVNADLSGDADAWLAGATEVPGSWWEDWIPWLDARGGERREPPALGSELHPPLEDAPGTYVFGTA